MLFVAFFNNEHEHQHQHPQSQRHYDCRCHEQSQTNQCDVCTNSTHSHTHSATTRHLHAPTSPDLDAIVSLGNDFVSNHQTSTTAAISAAAAAAADAPLLYATGGITTTMASFYRRFHYCASSIRTTLTTYLVDYSSYFYEQLPVIKYDNVVSISSYIITAERDTVSNWTSQFWSNLTKGWTTFVEKIQLPLLSSNSTVASHEITTRGSKRIDRSWSTLSVAALRRTSTVASAVKRSWPNVKNGIVSFVKAVGKRLNNGTRASQKFIVRKWRETKIFVVKNTMRFLLRIVNGLEGIVIGSADVGDGAPKQILTASQKEEKARYSASVGMQQPGTPKSAPQAPKPVQTKATSTTPSLKSAPLSTTSGSKPKMASSGTKKNQKSASSGSSSPDLSSKPSIMDQLAGALSPNKKESQLVSDVDVEPNALAGMFSSLASWGLYAAGGAAVVGYLVYNQYDSWMGGPQSQSSSSTTETDEIVNMEVDVISTTVTSRTTTPAARKMTTRQISARGLAAVTPDMTR
jgi:hypothetical protein